MHLARTRAERSTKRSGEADPHLGQAGLTQAHLFCSTSEIAIPRHEDDFLIAELKRGREVNRVVAAEPQIFGVLAGATGKTRIDADRDQVFLQLLEDRQCFCVLDLPQAALTARRCQCRASLRVGEDA